MNVHVHDCVHSSSVYMQCVCVCVCVCVSQPLCRGIKLFHPTCTVTPHLASGNRSPTFPPSPGPPSPPLLHTSTPPHLQLSCAGRDIQHMFITLHLPTQEERNKTGFSLNHSGFLVLSSFPGPQVFQPASSTGQRWTVEAILHHVGSLFTLKIMWVWAIPYFIAMISAVEENMDTHIC